MSNNYQPPYQNVNVNVTPVVNGKVVNKLAYILLAFFLGNFGIHNFYAGKMGMGILYLCFCWTVIPGIISIFQAFFALFKKADCYGNIIV